MGEKETKILLDSIKQCVMIHRFIFNLYKLVMFRQIYTEYGDTGKQWFPVKG